MNRSGRAGVLLLLLGVSACALPPAHLPEALPPLRSEAAAPGALEAGAAARPFHVAGDAWLAGYGLMRAAQGQQAPACARALALRRGSLGVLLIAVDVVGLHHHSVNEVRRRLADLVAPEAILVAATHTHSGPDTLGLWGLPPLISGIDPDALEAVLDAAARAGREAWGRLGPAVARWAQASTPAGVSRNVRDPERLDRTVSALDLRRPGGEPVGTLVHFACHPEGLGPRNRLLDPDFPGPLCAALEERRGGVAVFFNGALGGMVTPDLRAHTFADVERLGRTVADAADRALRAAPDLPRDLGLAWAHQPLEVPVENWRFRLGDLCGLFAGRPFAGGCTPSEVWGLRLGRLTLLSAYGEVLPGLGRELLAPVEGPALLIGLGNDELGYLIPPEEWAARRYRYERTVSAGPLSSELLRRAWARLLEALGVEEEDEPGPEDAR